MPDLVFGTKGVQETVAAAEKLRDAIDSQADATEKVSTSQRRLDSIARQINRRQETAQQRYNRLLKDTSEAFRKNKISAETYSKEVNSLGTEFKNSEKRFKSFADQQEETFGSKGQGMLQTWLGGFANVQAALALAKRLVEEINADVERGAETSKEARKGIGALRQVSGGSQKEFNRLTGLSRQVFGSGATDSLDEAARAVFSLASAGLTGDVGLFRDLGAKADIDIETLARATKTQLASFGKNETGGARQIVSKAIAASGFSPSSIDQLLESGARSAGGAKSLGISDEENLAALATLATSFGSAEQAGTSLASLFASVDLSGQFQGQNLREIVQNISSRGLDTEGLQKLLGRKEAIRAFRDLDANLSTTGGFDDALAAVRKADRDTSGIERLLGLSDPTTDAAFRLQQEEARSGLAAESLGGFTNLRRAVQTRERTTDLRQNGSFSAALRGIDQGVKNFFRPASLDEQILQNRQNFGQLTPEESRQFEELKEQKRIQQEQLEESRRQTKALDRISRQTGGLQGVAG